MCRRVWRESGENGQEAVSTSGVREGVGVLALEVGDVSQSGDVGTSALRADTDFEIE